MKRLALLSIAMLAVACDGSLSARDAQPSASDPDTELARDLQLAASAELILASAAKNAGRDMVLSAIEAGPAKPKLRARSSAQRETPEAAPEPSPANVPALDNAGPEASPPVPVAADAEGDAMDADEEAATGATVVADADGDASGIPAAGRPTPMPVPPPAADRGRDGDGGWGRSSGTVVIRGGPVGVDRCERHGRTGPIISINRRFPAPVFNPAAPAPSIPIRW